MEIPICENCGKPVFLGNVVKKQGGPHELCSDPDMLYHERLARPTDKGDEVQIGYFGDDGLEHWV